MARATFPHPVVIDNSVDTNPQPSNKKTLHSVVSGLVHAALLDNTGGTQKIHLYEASETNPREWTRQDVANAPVVRKSAKLASLVNTAAVGSLIWVVYVDNVTGNLALKSFHRTNRTWGAANVSSIDMAGLSSVPFCYWNDPKTALFTAWEDPSSTAFIEVRSNGDVVIIYPYAKSSSSMLGPYIGLKAVVFSGGVWGSPMVLGQDGANTYNFPVMTIRGAADRVHVFYINENVNLFHQAIGASNTVFAIQQLAHPDPPPVGHNDLLYRYKIANMAISELVGRGMFDGTTNIYVPYTIGHNDSSAQVTELWKTASVDNPVWSYGGQFTEQIGTGSDGYVDCNYAANLLPRNRMSVVFAAGLRRKVWLGKAYNNLNWDAAWPGHYSTSHWIYPVDRCGQFGVGHDFTYVYYWASPSRRVGLPHPAKSEVLLNWDLDIVNSGSIVQMMWTEGQGYNSRRVWYWEWETVLTNCQTLADLPPVPYVEELKCGCIGSPYSVTLQVHDGDPPFTFVLTDGTTLPPGLVLSSTGEITGTPTEAGGFTFNVKVTDVLPQTGINTFKITIGEGGSSGPHFAEIELPSVEGKPPQQTRFTHYGPWKRGDSLYVFVYLNADLPGSKHFPAQMYRSDDGGRSWLPVGGIGPNASASCCYGPANDRVTALSNTEDYIASPLQFWDFDLVTETWGPGYGAATAPPTSAFYQHHQLLIRANGNKVVVGDTLAGPNGGIHYVEWNGSSWSSVVRIGNTLPAGTGDYYIGSALDPVSGNIHFVWQRHVNSTGNNALILRVLNTSGVLGSEIVVDPTWYNSTEVGTEVLSYQDSTPIVFFKGKVYIFVFKPYNDTVFDFRRYQAYVGSPAASPTSWTTVTIKDLDIFGGFDEVNMPCISGFVSADGSKLMCLYANSRGDVEDGIPHASMQIYKAVSTDGAAWDISVFFDIWPWIENVHRISATDLVIGGIDGIGAFAASHWGGSPFYMIQVEDKDCCGGAATTGNYGYTA